MELSDTILIDKLKVVFPADGGNIRAVDQVTTSFSRKQVSGIIGETGCGKSVLGLALLKLLPREAMISGSIRLGERDVMGLQGSRLRRFRNQCFSLIPQNPSTSLNPIMKVGRQLMRALRVGASKTKQDRRIVALLRRLGFEDPYGAAASYPFQLSGGMRERILISLGLIRDPLWLLADEPTKGLDSALRASTAALLGDIVKEKQGGVILITHDIPLAEGLCDRILVMYGGHILEDGDAAEVIRKPLHPYTVSLIQALPENGFQTMPGPPIGIGSLPSGCRFHPRCPMKKDCCRLAVPELYETDKGRKVRCFLYAGG